MILGFALATPTSVPPSSADHHLRTSVSTLNRTVRATFKKRIYNMVVLWSISSIRKFANTVDISPHLGSLIVNLWMGYGGIKPVKKPEQNALNSSYEDVIPCLKHILATTSNLRHLYIAINIWGYWHKFECPIPTSVRHLVLPVGWQGKATPRIAEHTKVYDILPNLESLRIRGRIQGSEIQVLKLVSSRTLRIVIEMHHHITDALAIGIFLKCTLNPLLPDPWKSSVEVVSPPTLFKRSQAAIARSGNLSGSPSDVDLSTYVVSQPLGDVSQLELWLLKAECSLYAPF
ncbi:hypothetical protein FRC08_015680 [Ceratobasidium sp. 394]|nr:hypothetical protein FRC08_015680 [Ceratobasidium sp. 394]